MPGKAQEIGKYFRGGRIAIPIVVVAVILFFALGGHRRLMDYAVDETAEYLSGGAEMTGEEPTTESGAAREPEAAVEVAEVGTAETPASQVGAEKAEVAAAQADLEEEKAQESPPAGEVVKPAPPPPRPDATADKEVAAEPMGKGVTRTKISVYTASYMRDPFFSLVSAEEAAPARLLDVSRARMVGSVWGESGIIALLEDDGGRSYALKVGDRVINGTVISVTPASVTFSITLFGMTKSVTLELAEEGEW
jgi:hypothetical protein